MKKSLSLIAALMLLSPAVFARKSLCPAGSTEVSRCVATAVLPYYPFVSVCSQDASFFLMVDPGSTQSPQAAQVQRSEDDTAVVYSVTEEGWDGVKFTAFKQPTAKADAVMTFKTFSSRAKDHAYKCVNAAQ